MFVLYILFGQSVNKAIIICTSGATPCLDITTPMVKLCHNAFRHLHFPKERDGQDVLKGIFSFVFT